MKAIQVVLENNSASKKPKDRVHHRHGPKITQKLANTHNLHALKKMRAILSFLEESGWVTAEQVHEHMQLIGMKTSMDGITATIRDLRKCGYYVPLAKCTFKDGSILKCFRLRGYSSFREWKHAREVAIVYTSKYGHLTKVQLILKLEALDRKIRKAEKVHVGTV